MRISGKSGNHVTRQIHLGNNIDISLGGIAHNLLCLLLCVKSAVGLSIIFPAVTSYHSLFAHRTYSGKSRIFLYFYSPPLVVGKMPVESVQVVQSQHIDKRLHLIDAEEVAAHIEMCSTITEARHIEDSNCRQLHSFRFCHRERFAQRLYAAEKSGR